MTHEPDLTERQEQVLWALMAQELAADIDPTETGGLADDELAQHLGVSEDEIRHDIQALIDLGFIEHGPAQSAREDDWFRQVECDWQWPNGRYCNMTVHFYALAAGSLQGGRTDVDDELVVSSPDDADHIIDHLLDATEGIDAMREIDCDDKEQDR